MIQATLLTQYSNSLPPYNFIMQYTNHLSCFQSTNKTYGTNIGVPGATTSPD